MTNSNILSEYYNRANVQEYSNMVSSIIPSLNKITNNKFKNNGKVRYITIQVTEACNLACSYCYQINKSPARLSYNTAKKFIDLLLTDDESINPYINRYNTDFVIIDFIGGEPLLEIDLIDKIVNYFTKRCIELDHPWKLGYMLSIGTNGTLYFDERVQKFIKKHLKRLSMNITVDGDKELHDSCRVFHDGRGSYDLASSAVIDWMKITNHTNNSTKMTIAPENLKYLKSAIINMINLGFEFINENCVYEDVWNKDLAKELYYQLKGIADYLIDNDLENKIYLRILNPDSYKPLPESDNKNWCGGDGSMLAVDVDGNLFNCIRYMKSSLGDSRPPLTIGNVDIGIGQTEEHRKNILAMKSITRYSQSSEKCFRCPIANGCGWCSAYNYQLYGTVNKRTTTTCDMHIASSLASAYYWNKVLLKHNDPNRIKVYCPEEWAVNIIGQEEYDMIIQNSGYDKITERGWYDNLKPIKILNDGTITISE